MPELDDHDHGGSECKLCPLLQARVAELEAKLKAIKTNRNQYMREYRSGQRRGRRRPDDGF